MIASDCILFSGGAPGAEASFGACAEQYGVEEVNFTFEGHTIARHRGVRVLNHEELQNGFYRLEENGATRWLPANTFSEAESDLRASAATGIP